jgi:putative glutamine amidotransferase
VSAGRPRIGLSARILHEPPPELGFRGKTLQYLEQSVAHWLLAHDALAFMIPAIAKGAGVGRPSVSLGDYVRALDGLVLQGGADLSPQSYGEEPRRPDWAGDRVRDLYEIELFWECVIQGKPVLGICRGLQLINVALGGTLHQDLDTEIGGAVRHVDPEAYDRNAHEIEIVRGSGLARLYGLERRARVTSIHHQAIRKLGRGLVVEAVSPADGVIEAVRWNGASHVLGLQWHPEFHRAGDEGLLDAGPVMQEFLERAALARAQA